MSTMSVWASVVSSAFESDGLHVVVGSAFGSDGSDLVGSASGSWVLVESACASIPGSNWRCKQTDRRLRYLPCIGLYGAAFDAWRGFQGCRKFRDISAHKSLAISLRLKSI